MYRSLAIALVLWCGVGGGAFGGVFDDNVARKQIEELRNEVQTQNQTIDKRLKAIELSIKNLGLVELVNQLDGLNAEIGKLRGQIELQTNQLETTQKRQRDLYLDLDTRLRTLEKGAGVVTPKAEAAPPPAAAAEPAPAPAAKETKEIKESKDTKEAKEAKEAKEPAEQQAAGGEEQKPPPSSSTSVTPPAALPPPPAPAAAAPPPAPAVPPKPQAVAAPPAAASPAPPKPASPAVAALPPTPPRPPAAAGPQHEPGADIKAYEDAHKIFRTGDYQGAVQSFRGFIEQYPNSLLSSNAQYWIGISFYNMKELKSALSSHQDLLKRYPQSPKIPDSMLNIATIQSDMGDSGASRATLEDIVSKYPTSEAATKARNRLAKKP